MRKIWFRFTELRKVKRSEKRGCHVHDTQVVSKDSLQSERVVGLQSRTQQPALAKPESDLVPQYPHFVKIMLMISVLIRYIRLIA